MYQRILVPLDRSENSQIVLDEVKKMAATTDARVCLVKIVDTTQFADGPDELLHELLLKDDERMHEARREALRQYLQNSSAILTAAGIQTETRLVEKYGEGIAHAILQEADEWQADLLIMGTHGRSGLFHLLMGSVAEGVIRHAKTPVLLVKLPPDE